MSDVRLSNASPTLERVLDARQPDSNGSRAPPTRRNLFGTSSQDREAFHREVEAKMREGERAFAERWDFDVVNDRPLSPAGDFQWEAVVSPGFYSRPPHRRRQSPQGPRDNMDCNDNRADDDDVERSEVQSDTDSASTGLRKRPVVRPGRSSDECQSKRSHTDDDKDQSDKVERTPCKPDSRGL